MAHINSIGGCVNPYDVLVYAGVRGDEYITQGSGILDRHATWKLGNTGPLPPGNGLDATRSNDFATLAAGRPFVRMTYRRMGAWITQDAADRIRAAKVPTRDGAKISFSAPGVPCAVLVTHGSGLASIGSARACGRRCEDGQDVCAVHARAATKRAERDAQWAAERAERDAERERDAQTRRRAEELLEEAAPLLEALGLRPDTFTVEHQGRIDAPAESFDRLIRKAHEAIEMEMM